MNSEFYQKHCDEYYTAYTQLYSKLIRKPAAVKAITAVSKLLTYIVYAAYILLLGYLVFTGDMRIIKVLAVPAAAFVIITAIRKHINALRPYEKYPLTSLVNKSTKGNSCPSRHTGCAVIIALACLYVNIPFGIFMLITAALIGSSRPLLGVHFPLDVIFGAVLSLIIGSLGFFVI